MHFPAESSFITSLLDVKFQIQKSDMLFFDIIVLPLNVLVERTKECLKPGCLFFIYAVNGIINQSLEKDNVVTETLPDKIVQFRHVDVCHGARTSKSSDDAGFVFLDHFLERDVLSANQTFNAGNQQCPKARPVSIPRTNSSRQDRQQRSWRHVITA